MSVPPRVIDIDDRRIFDLFVGEESVKSLQFGHALGNLLENVE